MTPKNLEKRPPYRPLKYSERKINRSLKLTPTAWEWLDTEGKSFPGGPEYRADIIEKLADPKTREVAIEHISHKKKP